MELKELVCSVELAKELEHVGVKQNSFFYWVTLPFSNIFILTSADKSHDDDDFVLMKHLANEMYAAFSAEELGKILPGSIETYRLNIFAIDNLWYLQYTDNSTGPKILTESISDSNLNNALAKMLIYLINSGIKNEKT